MSSISKEYLYRECVKHRHCILLRLKRAMKWDDVFVDEIYMMDMCLTNEDRDQIITNILCQVDSYGCIDVKAFADNDKPTDIRPIRLSTDDIYEIEMINR